MTSINATGHIARPSVPLPASRNKRPHSARQKPTSAWERAEQFDRLGFAYGIIHANGGKTFTLRLKLDALVRVTGSLDPVRTMSRRFQRAFRRAGVSTPQIAFSLEVTPDERNELHVHGAVAPSGLSPAAVKDILRDAAGVIEGRAGSRQVKLKNFDLAQGGPAGWAHYTRRGAARTRREIDQKRLTYIETSLRREARMAWNAARSQRRPIATQLH